MTIQSQSKGEKTPRHDELRRGDVYWAYLDPTRGREQSGRRPVVIVSHKSFNEGPGELVFIVPTTTRQRGVLYHYPINPPEGGLTKPSDILVDQLRSISVERLGKYIGSVSPRTLRAITTRLRLLLDL